MQIVDLEEQLSQAAKQAAAMQMDRERLLSMVSRLELDKRRLEAGGSATATASPTDSATPQRGRSRCVGGRSGTEGDRPAAQEFLTGCIWDRVVKGKASGFPAAALATATSLIARVD